MKQQRILILGGAGFIGSHIARLFLEEDCRVGTIDGLVDGTGGHPRNIAAFQDTLEFSSFDRVEAVPGLKDRVHWADYIVDAMAFTGHMVGFEKPRVDLDSNLLSHLMLIDALKGSADKRVIYLGTRSQYGSVPVEVITEESPCLPVDPQGINKQAAEHFFRIYSRAHKFNVASLRLTNCYGPGQRVHGERGLVGGFIQDALDEKSIEIFGSAARTKNLLFGEDAARIVVQLAAKPWSGFDAFNVGGTEVSIQELLETIFEAAGKGSFTVKPFPEHVKRIDVGEARFSDEKLTSFLGNRERTALATAVLQTVDYFEQNQPTTVSPA
jgi:nucleoside-diphosphate-sugar epimerase